MDSCSLNRLFFSVQELRLHASCYYPIDNKPRSRTTASTSISRVAQATHPRNTAPLAYPTSADEQFQSLSADPFYIHHSHEVRACVCVCVVSVIAPSGPFFIFSLHCRVSRRSVGRTCIPSRICRQPGSSNSSHDRRQRAKRLSQRRILRLFGERICMLFPVRHKMGRPRGGSGRCSYNKVDPP